MPRTIKPIQGVSESGHDVVSCRTIGCTNWAFRGYIECPECMFPTAEKMPHDLARKKLRAEKGSKLAKDIQ